MTNEPMITLKAGDNVTVELPLYACKGSSLLGNALSSLLDEDDEDQSYDNGALEKNTIIPIDRVNSPELRAIVRFLIHHHEDKMIPIADPLEGPSENMRRAWVKPTLEDNVPQKWYREYVEEIGKDLHFFYAVRSAANFMDIKPVGLDCLGTF